MNQTIFKLSTLVVIIIASLFLNYCYPNQQYDFQSHNSEEINIIDVTFYDLAFDIDIKNEHIKAEAICHFIVLVPQDTFYLDLNDNLKVSAVSDGFRRLEYFQKDDKIGFIFPTKLRSKELKQVKISYSGKAQKLEGTGVEKGLIFNTHGNKEPVIATLSTPFLSHYWFPCKDDISDKADSVFMDITIPNDTINNIPLTAISNGKLIHQINLRNGKKLFRWQHRYPIAPCYIFFAVSNYKIYKKDFTDKFNNTYPVHLYSFAEDYESSLGQMKNIEKGLTFFTDLYGAYPFAKEGFGFAQIGFYSGIETQTCPIVESISNKRLYTLIHELSHAWFANSVTAESWQDAWLHEGFATYSEALYLERLRGKNGYLRAINRFEYLEKGSVFAEKTSNPFEVFSGIVYNKGAFVLHTLRGDVGEFAFFEILKEYYKVYQYKNVSTADFQAICELITGKEMDLFFNQWIYGTGHPEYYFSYYQNPKTLDIDLSIRQAQAIKSKQIYNVPLELYLDFIYKDSIIKINNSEAFQKYTIPTNQKLLNLDIDPNNWISKKIIMKKEILEVSNNSVYDIEINSNLSGRNIDVVLKSSKKQKATFFLKNIYGKTVFSKLMKVAGTSSYTIEIPRNVEGGYYTVVIETKFEKYYKNLTILH